MTIPSVVIFTISFFLVAIAAKQIGGFFSRYGLPYITGYLLAGTLAGPFILELMPSESTTELRYIDELSLAVIAFVAGSELYLKELRARMRSILLNTAGIVVAALILLGIAVFILTSIIPFTAGLPIASKIAVAVLGATILLALSPASTIAVIQEVRARGAFSKTVLSITVVMDVVIIILFAVSAALAGVLLNGDEFGIGFVIYLLLDLTVAAVVGYLAGRLISAILSTNIHEWVKIGSVLLIGLSIFASSYYIDGLKLGIHIEPLLICMIAGFVVTNFTTNRDQFADLLHDVSPYIYVAFFTLTGIALKLDILIASGLIALALFAVRMGSIFIGSYLGGTLAGEPANFRRIMWMGLITQAGIALGLSREVAVEFPTLGDDFATLIIAVVVLNEVFGPLFLKFALRRVGESNEPEAPIPDGVREALIFGVNGQSLALARQLRSNDWQVKLVDTNRTNVERMDTHDAHEYHIEEITEDAVKQYMTKGTDAVVTMMEDDSDNLRASEIAYERFGIKRLITRLNDLSLADRFDSMNAIIVDQASAMVNLLDQLVRTPQAGALTMHSDPKFEIAQITITDTECDGQPLRDLRLPEDVLIVEITRDGHNIVPRGYTVIHCGDEVTLIGKPDSIKQVTIRFGY